MRGGGLALVLVAALLLGAGLAAGSNALLVGSTAASLLVAVATIASARHRTAAVGGAGGAAYAGAPQAKPGGFAPDGPAARQSPQELPQQHMSAADLARLRRLRADVLVLNGWPRYHLPGCAELSVGDSEALSVAEALELGFTPCGACEPNDVLLPDAGC